MAVTQVIALLCLLSIATAQKDCAELTKTTSEREKTFGEWILTAGVVAHTMKDYFDPLSSSRILVTPTGDGALEVSWVDRYRGECKPGIWGALEAGDENDIVWHHAVHKEKQLTTCENCYVMYDESKSGDFLLLYTKDGVVPDADLEDFKKLGQCLNFPDDYTLYKGDLCAAEMLPED